MALVYRNTVFQNFQTGEIMESSFAFSTSVTHAPDIFTDAGSDGISIV
jgi:hypothetical protein